MSAKKTKTKNTAITSLDNKPVVVESKTEKATPKKLSAVKKSSNTKVQPNMTGEFGQHKIKPTKKNAKSPKHSIIRDSFPFPEQDYVKLSELKKNCLAAGIPVKKGEILRAGLYLLAKLSVTELKQAIDPIEKIKLNSQVIL